MTDILSRGDELILGCLCKLVERGRLISEEIASLNVILGTRTWQYGNCDDKNIILTLKHVCYENIIRRNVETKGYSTDSLGCNGGYELIGPWEIWVKF